MITIQDITKERDCDNYGCPYGTTFRVTFNTDTVLEESVCTLNITDFGWASYSIWGGYRKAEKTISAKLRDEDLYHFDKIKLDKLQQIYFILAEIISETIQTEDVESILTQLQAIGGLDL